MDAARLGPELEVFAWPEPPFVKPAEWSAGTTAEATTAGATATERNAAPALTIRHVELAEHLGAPTSEKSETPGQAHRGFYAARLAIGGIGAPRDTAGFMAEKMQDSVMPERQICGAFEW